MIPTRNCLVCRADFNRRPGEDTVHWETRRFCSTPCATLGKARPGRKPVEPEPMPMEWQRKAACLEAKPEEFFAVERWEKSREPELWATADRYCRRCPVLAECGAFADHNRHEGLWAGAHRSRPTNKYRARPLIAQAPPVVLSDRRNVA